MASFEDADEDLLASIRAGKTAATSPLPARGAVVTFSPCLRRPDGQGNWSYARLSIEPGTVVAPGITWLQYDGAHNGITFQVRQPIVVGPPTGTPATEVLVNGSAPQAPLPFAVPPPLYIPAVDRGRLGHDVARTVRLGAESRPALLRSLTNLIRSVAARSRMAMRDRYLADTDDLAQRGLETTNSLIDKYAGPARPLCPWRVALIKDVQRDLGPRYEAKLLNVSERVLQIRKQLNDHPELTTATDAARWYNAHRPGTVSEHVAAEALALPYVTHIGDIDAASVTDSDDKRASPCVDSPYESLRRQVNAGPSSEDEFLAAQDASWLQAWLENLPPGAAKELDRWLAGDRQVLSRHLEKKLQPHFDALAALVG